MPKKRRSKKKKSGNGAEIGGMPMSSGSTRERIDSGIEAAENGFIIRVSKEGPGKKDGPPSYESKVFIAPDRASAIRISSSAIQRLGSKVKGGKKKGGSKKRVSTKF